jgi:hypothetical protein
VEGVFVSTAGGTLINVAEGPSSDVFTASSLNNSGTLAFHRNSGIFTGSGEAVQTIAQSTVPPGGFDQRPTINDEGLVAFRPSFLNTEIPYGIYTGPNADKVIRPGDTLFGSTVAVADSQRSPLRISSNSLNNSGQIAFAYQLADGRQGIAIATPIPEPTAWMLSTMAMAMTKLTRDLLRFNLLPQRGPCRRGRQHGPPASARVPLADFRRPGRVRLRRIDGRR